MRTRGIAINVVIMEHAKVAKPHPTVLVIKQDGAVGSDLEVALTRAGVDVGQYSAESPPATSRTIGTRFALTSSSLTSISGPAGTAMPSSRCWDSST